MKNKRIFLKKYGIQISIGILLIFCFAIIIQQKLPPKICAKNVCFTVEIADTSEERQIGLMYRESLATKEGMVFVFEKSDMYNFWMKNTLIPLDMIWINEQYEIVKILTATPCTADPCPSYIPGVAAKYVLELNAGIAEQYGLIEGTTLQLKHIR